MAETLLETKLTVPPPRRQLVLRRRLITELNAGLAARLVLLSAPAGFGKTSLLSGWLKEMGLPAAWLSLDPSDNDPARFMAYLISGLQRVAPAVGHSALAMLSGAQPAPIDAVLVSLANDVATLPGDVYLCLDDYHLIEAQEVHEIVVFLIDALLPKLHLVIATRSDPPLALSRLRARGQLAELRQADLRFSTAEAAAFLTQTADLDLSENQIDVLQQRTEGWIAGLQLAVLALRGRADAAAFLESFSGSHRFVIDFLADEVLDRQTEVVRDFLLQTSILDRITAPLADHLTGRDDSAVLLSQLEQDNLFLIPLDDRRQWFRYHHLFRDFLRYQLDEGLERQLHRRAAHWFLAHGYPEEAVQHALASKDSSVAERVIAQAAPAAFRQGALSAMLRWLEALPSQMILGDRQLAVLKGFGLYLSVSYEAALPYLAAAERNDSPTSGGRNEGQYLSLKAHVTFCQDRIDTCIEAAREALDHLTEDDHSVRNLTLNLLGQAHELRGEVAAAAEVYRQAFDGGWQAGDQLGALVAFANLVFSLNELGRRREADTLCAQLAAQIEGLASPSLPLSPAVYLPWSLLHLEADRLDLAEEQVRQALDLVTAINLSQGISWAQYILAQIMLARDQVGDALQLISKGLALAAQTGRDSIHYAWFAALEAQAHLQQGSLAGPTRWAESMGYSPEDKPGHWQDQPYFTYARLLLARRRVEDARVLLGNMVEAAEGGGRRRKLITANLLLARTFLAQDDRPAALAHLSDAVRAAAPEEYRRAILAEGLQIIGLLPEVRAEAPAFVDGLLAALSSKRTSPPAGQLVEPLSERELEVLGLAARGLSNREIAAALFISLGTVKKHLNNIFGKLAVKSRTQAAARANELGLLD